MAHSTFTFFENQGEQEWYILGLTPIILLFYLTDIVLKAHYMHWNVFRSKRWNKINMVFLSLFVLDFVLYVSGQRQPFRCLRPLIWLCRAREIRRIYQAICGMHTVFLKILASLLLFLLFFAGIGIHTFPEDYHNVAAFNATDIDFTGSFDNMFIAMVRLFVLVTTENYPDIMIPR